MPIDVDVAHVAALSRLALSPSQLDRYRQELGITSSTPRGCGKWTPPGVIPLSHPLGSYNVFLPDRIQPSLEREEVLEMAPESRDGFFVASPALE